MNVLFLTHRLPYAPNRGDRIRAFHILHALQACGDVSLFSLVHDAEEEAHARDVQPLVARVRTARVPRFRNFVHGAARLHTRRPLTLELLSAPSAHQALAELVEERRPDVVLAYCSSMARYAMEPPLAGIPFVLDMVDLDSRKWQALASRGDWVRRAIYKREAWCLERFERAAINAARITLAVNEKEAAAVRQVAGDADIRVVSLGVDLESFAPRTRPAAGAQVVFCGVLDYPPNQEAALRLARAVWPGVRQGRPDARLVIVGANPSAAVRALAMHDPTVSVTGTVPDVRPYLWESAVAVVPLKVARGLQTKVLEAFAAGLPTIVTPIVAEGLPSSVRDACAIAESDAELARAILDLLATAPDARRDIARQAAIESFSWKRQLEPLCGILREIAPASAGAIA
jgi:polysaccharide biosynthesis protein PslH